MSEEDKELQKLTANWLNAMAAGAVTAGLITPIVGYQFGVVKAPLDADFISGSVIWFIVGTITHMAAYSSLLGYGER